MSWLVSWLLLRPLFYLVLYGTPLIGFWLASSLAAYLGGPHWIPLSAGLLMFPVIPGVWELFAWGNRSQKSKPWFTLVDRISLRTFVVGLAFLGGMLYFYPQTAFVALSTRGDWMLDGVKDERVTRFRPYLFQAAGALQWLYLASKPNPYKSHVDPNARKLADDATKQREEEVAQQQQQITKQNEIERSTEQSDPTGRENQKDRSSEKDKTADTEQRRSDGEQQTGAESGSQSTNDSPDQVKEAPKRTAAVENIWPWKGANLHPLISRMPASVETSITSVARYIREHETDQTLRIKALHDYVADRIAYDSDAYYADKIPDQSAEIVFKERKSVCAGYANLLSALAEAIGEKIIVVTGDARDQAGDKLAGGGHAWNAARIGDHWYLMDACWDAGYVSREKGFTKSYKTGYLLPPAEVMIQDHFPEDQNWQLLSTPLSQGDFLRQPMLTPSFHAADLRWIAPQRARNEGGNEAMVIVKNPDKEWLMAQLEQDGKSINVSSNTTNSETSQLICALPGKGTYRFNVFVSKDHKQYGDYEFVGCVDFVTR
jgi:hypothetical protein